MALSQSPEDYASERCVVVPAAPRALPRAKILAATLGLSLVPELPTQDDQLALVYDGIEAWLQRGSASIRLRFDDAKMLHRRKGGHNELLGRAVGIKQGKHPYVIDMTAGLGRDAFVLADLGCDVSLIERSAVLAWLLQQALEHALISSVTAVANAAARMQICHQDSMTLTSAGARGAVLYLDPMFPERKKTAAVKKDLAALQCLHGHREGEDRELFEHALHLSPERIVVKRPIKAPALGDKRATFTLAGKTLRFDVYQF